MTIPDRIVAAADAYQKCQMSGASVLLSEDKLTKAREALEEAEAEAEFFKEQNTADYRSFCSAYEELLNAQEEWAPGRRGWRDEA